MSKSIHIGSLALAALLAGAVLPREAVGAPTGTATIAVSVWLSPTSPTIACSPTSFSMTCAEGTVRLNRSLQVWNRSAGSRLDYVIAATPTWLSCQPTTGISMGAVTTHTLWIDTRTRNSGDHAATLTITAAGATRVTVPLRLRVQNVPPVVTITSVAPNPARPPNDVVAFAGVAADAVGSITSRQWRSNLDGPLSTALSFTQSANRLTVGAHSIRFSAWDDEGTSASNATSLTVLNALPTAQIQSITPNPASPGTTVSVVLSGQDNDEQSQRLLDGQLTSPAGARSGVLPGTHQFRAPSVGGRYIVSYRVRDDEGAWSATTTRTLDVSPYAPVLWTEPPYTSGTSNRIGWNSVAGAAAYRLQWSAKSSFSPLTGDSGWITTTTRLVTGLADGYTYFYRVKARSVGLAESPWSAAVSSRQDASPPLRPETPRDAGQFTSRTAVAFNWSAAADSGTSGSGIASYHLQVGTVRGGQDVFNANVGNVLAKTVTGSHGRTLYARVRAYDRAGNAGAWSADSDGITVDTVQPHVTGAWSAAHTAVVVTFDEPVLNAQNPANFALTRVLQVLRAERVNDMRYILQTTGQTAGTSYTLTVRSPVRDRAGNAIHPSYCSRAFVGGVITAAESWEHYR